MINNKYIFTILVAFISIFPAITPEALATRFFKQNSTWHEKIPANPSITPNSANYVADVIALGSTLGTNYREYGTPIFYANSSTPRYNIPVTSSYAGVKQVIYDNNWNLNVSIPSNFNTTGSSDGFTTVINTDTNEVWDFRHPVVPSPGTITSTDQICKHNLNDDGIGQPSTWATCIVSANPYLHGLITYEEIQAGVINHALAFGYNSAKIDSTGVYPLKSANSNGLNTNQWALLLGMRLQLDPSIDVNSLSLNRYGKIVAKAMQEYGMIFVVNTGHDNLLFAENLAFDPNGRSWTGIISDLNAIPLNRLRVVDPIYPPGVSPSNYKNLSYPAAVKPVIGISNGPTSDTVTVSLFTTTSNSSIRYTTNGSTPTSSSTLYTGPFTVPRNTPIKAITFRPTCSTGPYATFCYNDSGIASTSSTSVNSIPLPPTGLKVQ